MAMQIAATPRTTAMEHYERAKQKGHEGVIVYFADHREGPQVEFIPYVGSAVLWGASLARNDGRVLAMWDTSGFDWIY